MINNDWKTRHVRVPCFFTDDGWERGGITLRYKVVGEGIRYRYSICSPKDQYSRKIGVEQANLGFYDMMVSIYVDEGYTAFNLEAAILMHLVDEQRDELSKTTLDLIYSFVRNGVNRELKQFFYPKKGKGND